jgi:hypothetical protein
MKQAQVDADELIAAYRLEQQEAFDKKVGGKSTKMHLGSFSLATPFYHFRCISQSRCFLTLFFATQNRRIRQRCLRQTPSRNQ